MIGKIEVIESFSFEKSLGQMEAKYRMLLFVPQDDQQL
jgi:hypothetical protein